MDTGSTTWLEMYGSGVGIGMGLTAIPPCVTRRAPLPVPAVFTGAAVGIALARAVAGWHTAATIFPAIRAATWAFAQPEEVPENEHHQRSE